MATSTQITKTVLQDSFYDRMMGSASIGVTVRCTRLTGPRPACSKLMRQQTRPRPCRSSRAPPTPRSRALAIDVVTDTTPPRSTTRYPLTICANAARLAPEEAGAARAAASNLMSGRTRLRRCTRREEAGVVGGSCAPCAEDELSSVHDARLASDDRSAGVAILRENLPTMVRNHQDQGW